MRRWRNSRAQELDVFVILAVGVINAEFMGFPLGRFIRTEYELTSLFAVPMRYRGPRN